MSVTSLTASVAGLVSSPGRAGGVESCWSTTEDGRGSGGCGVVIAVEGVGAVGTRPAARRALSTEFPASPGCGVGVAKGANGG